MSGWSSTRKLPDIRFAALVSLWKRKERENDNYDRVRRSPWHSWDSFDHGYSKKRDQCDSGGRLSGSRCGVAVFWTENRDSGNFAVMPSRECTSRNGIPYGTEDRVWGRMGCDGGRGMDGSVGYRSDPDRRNADMCRVQRSPSDPEKGSERRFASVYSFSFAGMYREDDCLRRIKDKNRVKDGVIRRNKKRWQEAAASITVEASLVVPLALIVIFLLISLDFYVHDKAYYTLCAFETVMTGNSYGRMGQESGERYAKEKLSSLLKAHRMPTEVPQGQVKVTDEHTEAVFEGSVCQLWGHGIWKYHVSAEAKNIRPEERIRRIRMVENIIS